jgi:hypothetical protein
MKLAILSISSLLLLAIQVNAQQPSPQPVVTVNNKITSHVTANVVVAPEVNVIVNTQQSINIQDREPQKVKTFTKTFTIDKNDKISLSNQYGAMTIKTWDKNEIKVDAEIKAYANTDAEAQKLLDDVSINATKTGDLVTYKTTVGERNGNWGSSVKNGKIIWRREVKTYFTVYMPSINALSASQSYGNIQLDDFSGPTSLKVKYGNLVTGDLKNSNNYISVQYGKANLKNVNQARISHQYGDGLTLANINDLELEAEYTAVNIGTIKNNANIKNQYGSGVIVGYAGSLNLTAEYADIKVGKLAGTFTGTVVYGKLDVSSIEAACKIFNVGADYSSINLGFNANYAGKFNVTSNYGGFTHGSRVTTESNGNNKGSSKSYAGLIGNGGSGQVAISANYGSVTFK